jgi:hypothetical protein
LRQIIHYYDKQIGEMSMKGFSVVQFDKFYRAMQFALPANVDFIEEDASFEF